MDKITVVSFYLSSKITSYIKQFATLVENELIEDCRKGDLQNFRKVVEKTSPMVFSVAFRMLGDENAARDIVQETLLTIWQKMDKIRRAGSFKTWVYRIAVNKCYDEMRKQKRRNESRFDDHAWALISNHLSDNGITELENNENAMVINLLTNKLSPKQKAVFVLSELEEIPADEVAEITGMSKSVVKDNLYYSRKNIESLLQKYLER